MPKPTKLVVYFDDGSTYEIPADGTGSIFIGEEKAKKCGHKPPYKKPPKPPKSSAATESQPLTLMSAANSTTADTTEADTSADDTEAQVMEGSCYLVNGVIVCP
jgi:hypothetical protein